jgi:hypothetical protein
MNSENISVKKDLLLDFFLTFSKFEYALKNSRFKRRARHGGAEPDWIGFINVVVSKFNQNENLSLKEACTFYLDYPPRKQVLFQDDLSWETQSPKTNESEEAFILRMIKTVRNNLFHGSKHNIGLHEDSKRVTLLLTHALEILNYVSCLENDVSEAFNDARI